MNLRSMALLSMLTILISACSSDNKPKSSIVKINGDPEVFLASAKGNGNQTFPKSLFDHTTWNYEASGVIQKKLNGGELEQFLEENTPGANDPKDALKTKLKRVAKVTAKGSEIKLSFEDVSLIFQLTNEGYKFDNLISDGKVISKSDLKVIHTSYTPDLSAFNILFLSEKSFGAKALVALNFIKKESTADLMKQFRFVDKLYEYINGAGVAVGWNQKKPVKLVVCGSFPDEINNLPTDSIEKWKQALHNRLELESSKSKSCPPFSDLNTRTFTYINDWIEIPGEHAALASTQILTDYSKGQLIDSDIFVLLGEIKEALDLHNLASDVHSIYSNPNIMLLIGETITHELGHLLGLHHKFDDNIPSIMSYADDRLHMLTTYDRNAIQALYPFK